MILNMLQQSLRNCFVRAGIRRLNNNSLRNLSRTIIRNSDNSTVRNIRMSEEMGFELGGCDLQTLGMECQILYFPSPGRNTNLDLDQLLNSVDDEHVLHALRTQTDNSLVSGEHPSVHECLLGGLFVVQIAQDDTGAANYQFAWCIVCCDFFAFWCHNAGFEAGDQGAGGTEEDVVGMG
jgi:hypothetical protein